MTRFRKWIFISLSSAILALLVPVVSKSLPWVRENECYRTLFSKEVLESKLKQPTPSWMVEQIDRDFQDFKDKILPEAVEKTYQTICSRVGSGSFFHYRILDNELYKYIPAGTPFSDTDSPLEKALKTVLLRAHVPNVDFILCTMDGLPEPYMPSGFFVMENAIDQAPILAQAKLTHAKYIVLIPDQFSLSNQWADNIKEIRQANRQISWEDKKPIALWRGGLSDIGQPNGRVITNYTSFPRFIISKLSLQYPALIDAGMNWADPEMATVLQNERILKGSLSKTEHLYYKYLPILDGHMCTYPGYQWRLLSNSVCFKQTSSQIQWFYSALQPYVHYVPIQNDMSDLVKKVEWAKAHDDEMIQISNRAQKFAQENLLMEDDYLYLDRVLERYAAIEKADFQNIKKCTLSDPHWKCIQYRKRLALYKSIDRVLKK